MDANTLIVVLIPSILASAVALINIYLSFQRLKEPPKDEIWETVTKILCSGTNLSSSCAAVNFAEIYVQLKEFKEGGYQLPDDSELARERAHSDYTDTDAETVE